MKEKYKQEELEAFMEMGNVGAGHSAIALTKLFKREVDMSVPFVRVGEPKDILDEIGIELDDLVGYEITEVMEPIRYKLSVLFKPHIILSVLNLLSNTSKDEIQSEEDLTDMQKSMMQEIGSTIMLRYIAALNKMLKVEALPDIAPEFKFDAAEAAIGAIDFSDSSDDEFVLIQLDLFTDESKFECHLFIQQHPESLDEYRKAFFLT